MKKPNENSTTFALFYATHDPHATIKFLTEQALKMRDEGASIVSFGDIVFDFTQWQKDRGKQAEISGEKPAVKLG